MSKKPDKAGPGGARVMKTRIKKKSGLKESSRRWLERHINDPYVQRSKADGYRSRSAYKLIEIDDRHHILKPGARVIDLGAAPGGWCQVAAVRVKSSEEHPSVVGIDYLGMDPVPGATVLMMDFLDDDAPARLIEALGGDPDVVLSDMAAPTTGHRRTDHIRTMHLAEVAADFAISVLRPGGHFLVKAFQGGTENTLLDLLKRSFRSVRHVKPPASRDESVELYLLAKDFKGRAEAALGRGRGVSSRLRRLALGDACSMRSLQAPAPSACSIAKGAGAASALDSATCGWRRQPSPRSRRKCPKGGSGQRDLGDCEACSRRAYSLTACALAGWRMAWPETELPASGASRRKGMAASAVIDATIMKAVEKAGAPSCSPVK